VRGPASGAKEEREFPQDPPGVLPGDERLTGRVLTLPGALRNPLQANEGISASLAWALGPAPPNAQTLNHPQVLDLKRTSRANPPLQRPVARRPRPPQNPPVAALFTNGETRTRTGDTTIFRSASEFNNGIRRHGRSRSSSAVGSKHHPRLNIRPHHLAPHRSGARVPRASRAGGALARGRRCARSRCSRARHDVASSSRAALPAKRAAARRPLALAKSTTSSGRLGPATRACCSSSGSATRSQLEGSSTGLSVGQESRRQ
jgi:hypothetical protein